MNTRVKSAVAFAITAVFVAGSLSVVDAANVRSKGRSTVSGNKNANRNTNVNRNNNSNRNVNVNNNSNRNINVNTNRNVNVDVDVNHRGGYYGGCCYHESHPVAAVAGVILTAAVIGSIVNSLPPDCATVVVNGFAYQQCGNTWYQPQIAGSSTTYVVVNSPR